METQLKSKGWNLSVEGLKSCMDACQKSNPTVNDIIKKALDSDLRHIGQKNIPENINSGQIESIKGPIVLQLQKVRNITAPLINQESGGAPRMMKLTLTDGCTTCVAIEFKLVNCLKLDMIPGIKLCLTSSSISLLKGVILLEDGDVKILGGEVEKLKSKWESNREAKCLKKYDIYFKNVGNKKIVFFLNYSLTKFMTGNIFLNYCMIIRTSWLANKTLAMNLMTVLKPHWYKNYWLKKKFYLCSLFTKNYFFFKGKGM